MKNLVIFLFFFFVLQSCGDRLQTDAKTSDKTTAKQEIKETAKKTTEIPTPTHEIVEDFYKAIFNKDVEKVKRMLATEFPANYLPKNKIPPLQALIWSSDDVDLTKLFVEGGAKINDQKSPLIVVAAEYGRLKILKYLIAQGCDIKNNEAFNKAGLHQFFESAKLLLINGANQEKGDIRGKLWVFEQAVIRADYEVLNELNLTTEELNSNNCDGETALIIAVKQNNVEMTKYLLNKNVDRTKVETFDCGDNIGYGKTPIQIAKKNNFQEIVELLK